MQACLVVLGLLTPLLQQAEVAPKYLVSWKQEIVRADYAADYPRLERLYNEGARYTEGHQFTGLVRYWRGFAMWRRAINGFNDVRPQREIQHDLLTAAKEFDRAASDMSVQTEAQLAFFSTVGYLAYLLQNQDHPDLKPLLPHAREVANAVRSVPPTNPRYVFVFAPLTWLKPDSDGQSAAIELCQKALANLEANPEADNTGLDVVWGEPELEMMLAYYHLNMAKPDPVQAKSHALRALKLVPDWHYVKDILLKQIEQATTIPPANAVTIS